MKRLFLLALVLGFSLSTVWATDAIDSEYERWVNEFKISLTRFGIEVPNVDLKDQYARKLIYPKILRRPSLAVLTSRHTVILQNVVHEGKLWATEIDPKRVSQVEIINSPIAPGVFHFATLFHFEPAGLILYRDDARPVPIKSLVMGTGPEDDFSVGGVTGFQVIQMRAGSLQEYSGGKPIDPRIRRVIDPKKVDLGLFFLTTAEESARLGAMTISRALQEEWPDRASSVFFQKYSVLGANCISSGIQNLTRAVRHEFHPQVLQIGAKDIDNLQKWTPDRIKTWIWCWNRIHRLALQALEGKPIDPAQFRKVEAFQRYLRKTNMMALPWRAEKIIAWAALP